MNFFSKIKFFIAVSAFFVAGGIIGINSVVAADTDGVIDVSDRYAWGENSGWVDFGTTEGAVAIGDSALTGYAYGENIGWISLNCSNDDSCGLIDYGVDNDGNGALSGYAWSENVGWIDFDPFNGGITIDSSGQFSGYAYGENVGWIVFSCSTTDSCGLVDYGVNSTWIPQNARPCTSWTYSAWSACSGSQQTRTIVSSLPSGCTGGSPVLTQSCSTGGGSGGGVVLPIFVQPPVIVTETSTASTTEEVTDQGNLSTEEQVPSVIVSPPAVRPPKKTIIESIPDSLQFLIPQFIKDKLPQPELEANISPEALPKQAPLALSGKWQIIPSKPLVEFVFAQLPQELALLMKKLPQLSNTFSGVGVNRMTDLNKLASANLTLPGLTDAVGLSHADLKGVTVEELTGIRNPEIKASLLSGESSVPLAVLNDKLKDKIPSGLLFVQGANDLVDIKPKLSLDSQGSPEQKINAIVSKPLTLTIKPDRGVKDVRGYLLFKSRETALEYRKNLGIEDSLRILAVKSDKFDNSEPRIGVTSKEVAFVYETVDRIDTKLAMAGGKVLGDFEVKGVEERFILEKFFYNDNDGDGIYTATINTPAVEGEYEIVTIMDYEINGKIVSKEVIMKTIIDPEGYVYEKIGDRELRLPQVVVTIYRATDDGMYEIWSAEEYNQTNPQTTDVTGKYSFLVPPGRYYISAKATGYQDYQGEPFDLQEGKGVHSNIELKPKGWIWQQLDWKLTLIVIVALLLFYNFYRDWRRKSNNVLNLKK